ncbi:hypothetical protein LUZ60_001868 [Juncus effusus]|nr:hypothetical protein LUZ60_001868 [Juncus effusus]
MSITRWGNTFDPFSLDMWDPFQGFPFNNNNRGALSFPSETSVFATAFFNWKETPEAHVLKADHLPGIKKKEVKEEVEEGTYSRSAASGPRRMRRRRPLGTMWRGAVGSSQGGSGCQKI